ncbi:MAG: NAD(P)/FAD-dependent oxidoreductase [Desulfosalsimonadaceae bacterium]
MNLRDRMDISRKTSEAPLRENREQILLPFFRARDAAHWQDETKKIVVIGSGIGGMASGALFAKTGHQVAVLEQNPALIGGHGRCLKINGMRYSMGPQYVWDFGDGQLGDRFLKFLDIKAANPFVPMQPDGFERIFIGSRRSTGNACYVDFKVPLGLENFRRDLTIFFPEESDKIDGLFSDMLAIFDAFKSFFNNRAARESRFLLATRFMLAGTVPMAMKLKLGRTLYQSVRDFFDHYGISPLLRRILYGHGGIFAESESDMSAIAYIVGTGNYHAGAWYPKNGFYHFFDSLAEAICQAGGTVETGKKVIRLESENNRVTKAVCEDGSSYECDVVFSDVSPRLTYQLLGIPEEAGELDYTPSHSIPACCIGVKGGLESIAGMRGRNYWWQDGCEVNYNSPDVTAPPQMLFIASPSANGHAGPVEASDDALVVFCPGNYFQEKKIYARGAACVEQFKRGLAGHIVEILEKNVFPGIKSRVMAAEVKSSIDIEADTSGELGNAYGRRLSVDEILKGPVKEKHCPANLYNVSATKNTPGIAGGIATAELLFKELTGRDI